MGTMIDPFLFSLYKAYFLFKAEHSESCIQLEHEEGTSTNIEVECILKEKELVRLFLRPFVNRASEQIAFSRTWLSLYSM